MGKFGQRCQGLVARPTNKFTICSLKMFCSSLSDHDHKPRKLSPFIFYPALLGDPALMVGACSLIWALVWWPITNIIPVFQTWYWDSLSWPGPWLHRRHGPAQHPQGQSHLPGVPEVLCQVARLGGVQWELHLLVQQHWQTREAWETRWEQLF